MRAVRAAMAVYRTNKTRAAVRGAAVRAAEGWPRVVPAAAGLAPGCLWAAAAAAEIAAARSSCRKRDVCLQCWWRGPGPRRCARQC